MKKTLLVPLSLAAASALALSGCSQADAAGDASGLSIVASTNVYGSIASAIAGDAATVTSIIDSSAQDPHSYEASAHDRLAVSKADIVIENGGGYDPFIDSLLHGSDPVVISASEESGLLPADAANAEDDHEHAEGEHEGHDHIEGFNEHVWYSLDAVTALAEHLVHELSELEPGEAETFEANFDDFAAQLDDMHASLHAIDEEHGGSSVLITEPVPLYLLADAGFVNKTPDAFSEAIEEGNDVSATVVQQMLELVESGDIALLAYNEQTSGPITEQVKDAAVAASVPVVSFTETLPDGDDYVSWMTSNIDALSEALTA